MLITKKVKVIINPGRQSKYYSKLGYEFSIGDEIDVDIKDLPKSSLLLVKARCDYCGHIKELSYKNYNNYTKNNPNFACSRKCASNKMVETNLAKYGVENPFKSEIVKKKIKESNIRKYGVENYTQTDEYLEKTKETNLEKYGEVSYSMTKEFKEMISKKLNYEEITRKVKKTNLAKYGVENYTQTDEFKKKIKQSNFNKFNNKIKSFGNLIDSNDGVYKIKCNNCGKVYDILHTLLYTRRLNGLNPCFKCTPKKQNFSQNEITSFLLKEGIKIDENNREILSPLEIDIYLPYLNIGLEYNGLYWHSELYKEDNYHKDKTDACDKSKIQLIHIFEDEWLCKKDIVKSRLLNLIGKSDRIYARKCEIKEVTDNKLIREFLNKNHLQGFVGSKIKLGLYFEGELVSLMTFGNLRKNLGQSSKEGYYELLRFCNKLNTTVVGGASKLFKYFLKNYQPEYIVSYADRRWSQGNLYENLGFKFVHNTSPSWFYNIDGHRVNRFNFRKDKLVSEGADPNKTARQIMLEKGYYRIYDCGSSKWELNVK